MIQNFLKIAFRQLWKHKLLTGLNLVGLSAAIAGSLLLLLTAFFQLSFDQFHEKGDRLHRVFIEINRSRGVERGANLAAPLRSALLEEVPEVERSARWVTSPASVDYEGKILPMGIEYTDPQFFQMFSFPLVQGHAEQVLGDLNSVVLTQRASEQIFGKEVDPIGKTIRVVHGEPKSYVVSGIISNTPENSSIRYNMIVRFENYPSYQDNKDNWNNQFTEVFVELREGASLAAAEQGNRQIVRKYLNESLEQLKRDGAGAAAGEDVLAFHFQPVKDLHFDRSVNRQGSGRVLPYGLVLLSFFILGIACINFVNLTLGTAIGRAREVGVRKALGATRAQLLGQFWGETLVMAVLALLTGGVLAQLLLPGFNANFRANLELWNPHLLGTVVLILAFVGLAGGAYPALLLSRFQAARVLKGDTDIQRPGRLRNGLILVQFTLSVLLISCTIIVGQQLEFLRNTPLGFNKDQVISIPLAPDNDPTLTISRLRNELSPYPEVRGISGAYRNLGLGADHSTVTSIIGFIQNEKEYQTYWVPVDYDYLETLEIPLVAGRDFSRERGADSTEAIIINETFAEKLGVDSALGMVLEMEPRRQVIGIMKDFHFESLQNAIGPMSFVLPDQNFRLNYVFVRVAPENTPRTMARLEQAWKRINPQTEYLGSFLNENNQRLYETERMMGRLFTSASLLAILLSCMGLFGVALLVIAQRTKEIGIRKVLGASVGQVVGLITRAYVGIVLLAFLIATPVAWWAMTKWLENYAYRIPIHWWVFPLAGLMALLIALLTLSWQSFRAATGNPVEALRDE